LWHPIAALLQKGQILAYGEYASALTFFRALHSNVFEQPGKMFFVASDCRVASKSSNPRVQEYASALTFFRDPHSNVIEQPVRMVFDTRLAGG
jgi:hypothetical protein